MSYSKKFSLVFFATLGRLASSLSLAPQEIVTVDNDNVSLVSERGPQTPWTLCDAAGSATRFSSNLGGNGPDSGPEEFRVVGAVTVDGKLLDLVITVSEGETYKSHIQKTQKRTGGAYVSPCQASKCEDKKEPKGPPCYIVIPLEVKTKTTFTWKFVSTGTSNVYSVHRFGVTIFELDQERNDWDGAGPDRQYIEYNTQVSSLNVGSKVKETTGADGLKRVESMEAGDFKDNPPMTGPPLTDSQKERSAEATYRERGQWEITIGHTGGNSRFDRNVVFSGWTMNKPTPAPTPSPTPNPTPAPPTCGGGPNWKCDKDCHCWPKDQKDAYDCDSTSECPEGCYCEDKTCAWYSWGEYHDCCTCPKTKQCGQPTGWDCNPSCDACWPRKKVGSYDCDRDSDCPEKLKCGNANCAWYGGLFNQNYDCCNP